MAESLSRNDSGDDASTVAAAGTKNSALPTQSVTPGSSIMVASATYVGPIPPPQILREYEKTLPGAAERIIKMAELEQAHRHKSELDIAKADAAQERLVAQIYFFGKSFSFFLGITGIIAGAILCYNDKNISGFSTILLSLGSLLAAFIYKEVTSKKTDPASEK